MIEVVYTQSKREKTKMKITAIGLDIANNYLKKSKYPILLTSNFPGSPSFANQLGLNKCA